MAKKVQFGLDEVYIAPITIGADNSITYDTPFAIPGAVSITLDQAGDESPFYADNVKYFNSTANQGYSGTLEMALFTEDFKTKILGMTKDSNGVIVENSDDVVKDFALGFRFSGDTAKTRYWTYQVSAQRPSVASSTIEASKTPQTQTINITATPRVSDKNVMVHVEEGSAAYSTFFNSVYETTISR